MPIFASSQLPAPTDWEEFESLCADLFAAEWADSNVVRHGRRGQRQDGVDVFGRPEVGGAAGVQCKGKTRWPPHPLTETEVRDEVEKAKGFFPPLTEFIVATTADDDAALQKLAREITQEHNQDGLFEVQILGWKELSRRIAGHDKLVEKYYGYVGLSTLRGELASLGILAQQLPGLTARLVAERLEPRVTETHATHRPSYDSDVLRRLRSASQRTAYVTNIVQTGGPAGALSLSANLYVQRNIEHDILRALAREDFETNLILVQGEPGTGKSSVLWALRRRLESELSAEAWLIDALDLRAVFGNDPRTAVRELEGVVAQLGETGRPPVVLIDTVDLALTSQNDEAYLISLLTELPAVGAQVVVSSRPGEARILSSLEPRSFVLYDYSLPEFRTAVTLHSRAFVRVRQTNDASSQAGRLLEAAARGLPIREICRNPLTLRMLYTIYAPHDINVEDVDVASLYRDFWDRRVAGDIRTDAAKLGAAGRDLSAAAMRVAVTMLIEGNPELPADLLRQELVQANLTAGDLELLISRGVLKSTGDSRDPSARFFHQTFFEHAAAVAILRQASAAGLSALVDRFRSTDGNLFVASVLERALVVGESEPFETRDRASDLLVALCQEGAWASSVVVYAFVHRRTVPPSVTAFVSELVASKDAYSVERLLGIAANAGIARRRELIPILAALIQTGATRWVVRSLDLLLRFHPSAPIEVAEALRTTEIGTILRQGTIDSPQARYGYIDILLAHLPFETDWALNELSAIFRKAVHQRSEDLALRVLVGLRDSPAVPKAASALSERARLLTDPSVAVRLTSQRIAAALGDLFVSEWRAGDTKASTVVADAALAEAHGLALDARAEGLAIRLGESDIAEVASALRQTAAIEARGARIALARACWAKVLPALFDSRSQSEITDFTGAVREMSDQWPASKATPLGDILFNAIRHGPMRQDVLRTFMGDEVLSSAAAWMTTDALGGRLVDGMLAGAPGALRALDTLIAKPNDHPLLASAVLGQLRLLPTSDETTALGVRLAAQTDHLEATIEFLGRASNAQSSWQDLAPTLRRMVSVRYASGNPGTRRESVRLEMELLRLGLALHRSWDQLARELVTETDDLARSYLAEASRYLLPQDEADLTSKLAWLLRFGGDQSVRVRKSIVRVVGAIAAGHPKVMSQLLDASLDVALGDDTDGEMLVPLSTPIFNLYQQDDPRVVPTLFRIIDRCGTLPMHACRMITGTFRKQFALVGHHLSESDSTKLLDQVPSMNPYVARMVLQGLIGASIPDISDRLAAIARNPSSHAQTVDLASRLLHAEQRSALPARWPELHNLIG